MEIGSRFIAMAKKKGISKWSKSYRVCVCVCVYTNIFTSGDQYERQKSKKRKVSENLLP